jgi:proteasome lid subunit RPN8/RPN11
VTEPQKASIRIAASLLDEMIAHARTESPRECCGLLVGNASEIVERVATRNVDPSPNRFQVDPRDHIELNRQLRGTERHVVGVYHSHPHGPATPSASDVAEALYAEFVHVIVSLDGAAPSVRAFDIRDGGFTEIALSRSGRL